MSNRRLNLKNAARLLLLLCSSLSITLTQAGNGCGTTNSINPITDICWRCIFPIFIGSTSLSTLDQVDSGRANGYPSVICLCPKDEQPYFRIGIGITFWEPARIAEAVREPWCSPVLGGSSLGEASSSVVDQGGNRTTKEKAESVSFYHVHWFVYPVMYWFNMMVNQQCVYSEQFDVAFMTELDPMWNNDEMSFLLNPEAVLFDNLAAQAVCAVDCLAASAGYPLDMLFWCLGCQVALHPLTGTVKPHEGGLASSTTAVKRMHAILHRTTQAQNVSTPSAMCAPEVAPIMQKSWYKTQLLRPVPITSEAHPYGMSTNLWHSGKEFPVQGEDFAYMIWRRRVCCVGSE